MQARGVVQSPVLVGRDAYLALAGRRLADAAAGAGQLLFVAGEAGIGKTRLLAAIARQAGAQGFAVVRAAAFPGDRQSLAGLLLDLASDLLPAREPVLSDLGRSLTSRLREVARAGDAHHRRRLLVQDVADLVTSADPGTPLLIVLEDLHWADELSLDVLGHLAGRLASRPVLVAGAYRSDELYPQLPMRDLRARLVGQRLAEEIRLPRLKPEQTATMTRATLGLPVPAQVLAAIHARSDGIPLHVEEFLAAIDDNALTAQSGAAVQAAAVPDTLADAVLTRARRLASRSRQVAAAAAVIGRSFDFDLLTAVTEGDPDEVAGALRELQDAYFVLPGADAVTYDFRHALIRDALYTDTGLPLRRRLHERVARTAVERGYRDAFISAHFEQAGNPGLAYEYAVAAAREAASLSAHGEALELYRRALRNLPAQLAPLDRAGLLAAAAGEAAATDDNAAAAQAYQAAHELVTGAGDVRAAAALAPRMAAVAHLLGEGLDARVGTLQAALDDLDGVAEADLERARLHSAMAAAYLLDDRLDEAITHGELSRSESQRIGDDEAALNAAATLGTVLVFAGRMGEGWHLLEDAIARARGAQQEAEAARGYRMIGSSASELVEYDRAERWLADGIRYAEQAELWNHRHYMASQLAHVQWATGQWNAARQTAQHALADGRGGSPPGSPRSTSWASWRWRAVTGKPPTHCSGRRSPRGSRWPSCSGCRRRCGGWPKPHGAGAITAPRSRSASVAIRPRPTSRAPPTFSRTCLPGCGRTWRAAISMPPRPGRTGSGRCSPPAPFPARCPRSLMGGDSSCSPAATCRRRAGRWNRQVRRGGPGAGSGRARGHGSTSRPPRPGHGGPARRRCCSPRSAPMHPRSARPCSPPPPTSSPSRSAPDGRRNPGIR